MAILRYNNELGNNRLPTREEIDLGGYRLNENSDGTVSVYLVSGESLIPITGIYTRDYCESLNYSFDPDNQYCKWTDKTTTSEECEFEPFKLILNPNGNSSVIFNSDVNDTCSLNISFDYLLNFECDVLEGFIRDSIDNNPLVTSVNARNSELEGQLVEKEAECERLRDLITLEESYNIPFVLQCNGVTYCLDENGLIGWRNTLGETRYNAWLASFGSDITLYGCEDVNAFIFSRPPGFSWFTESCGFTVYDKLESMNKIASYQQQLETCGIAITEFNSEIISGRESIESIEGVGGCQTYIDIFESLDIRFNLEKLNKSTGRLETVYQETIFNVVDGTFSDYVANNVDSTGLLIEGQCDNMKTTVENELLEQYIDNHGSASNSVRRIFNDWFDTCWLRYEREISDSNVIDELMDENINISISVMNSCVDFSILLDRVKIKKNCEKVENVETFISEPPKFDFRRVPDNKKSWIANKDRVERDFHLKYRGTEYFSNEQRLTINSKEIDLNLSPARAVEQDVWCYINDNNCILERNCHQPDIFDPYFCPIGFQLDINPTNCIMTAFTNTVNNGETLTADRWYNFNRVSHYGLRGTIFVEDDVNDLAWPLFWTGTPINTWVGPYYNVDYLTDSSGTTIMHSGFGTEYKPGNILRWSSPEAFSGYYSEFGTSELPMVNGMDNPNLLWGGTPGLNSMVMAGRLFNAGIWVSGTGVDNQFYNNMWIGFAECITLSATGVYNIGFAADDKVRLKVNGDWLINSDITPFRPIGLDSGFDTFRPNTRFTQAYVVLPITLYEGKNIIEFEGFNGRAGDPAGFAFEIYDASTSELKAMTTEPELDAVTIFSTKDFIGETFDVAGDTGYFCPTGYALDTCLPEPYQCLQINRIPSIETEQIYCCCPGDPIIVTGLNGALTELDVVTPTGTTLDCNDILTAYTANSEIVTIESECREVFKIGNETETTFDGFWITQENDGVVGVYDVNWVSGVTANTYVSVTDLVDADCCEVISNVFQLDSDDNHQGDNQYPSISWDKNRKKCTYQRCGDDGCIVIDDLLTTEVTEFDTVEEFSVTLSSELIDVKNRQTIPSYATLKMLYDRYNLHALEYCDLDSSKFDYFDMDNFGQTVGDYWVDLIEQVIPATTLWNSTYQYRNTLFDQQKFQYKKSSLFPCVNPSNEFPMNPIGHDSEVEVILETLPNSDTTVSTMEECSGVWVMANSSGTEYFGTIGILNAGTSSTPQLSSKVISEIRDR